MAATRRGPAAAGLLLLLHTLLSLCIPTHGIHTPPTLVLNTTQVGSILVQTSFTEGGLPTAVTLPGEVGVTGVDDFVVSASVALTPLDAPYELLGVTPSPGVVVSYNTTSGLLLVDASRVTPASASTAAVAGTLGTVTYNNTSQAPTGGARVLVWTVTDASGASSAPAVAVVTVVPVNQAPVLILSDPAAYASGSGPNYTALLYETERTTPVALASPSLVLSDVDNVNMNKALLTLTGTLDGPVEVRGWMFGRTLG